VIEAKAKSSRKRKVSNTGTPSSIPPDVCGCLFKLPVSDRLRSLWTMTSAHLHHPRSPSRPSRRCRASRRRPKSQTRAPLAFLCMVRPRQPRTCSEDVPWIVLAQTRISSRRYRVPVPQQHRKGSKGKKPLMCGLAAPHVRSSASNRCGHKPPGPVIALQPALRFIRCAVTTAESEVVQVFALTNAVRTCRSG
jgi:hypothetical protein